MQGWGSQLIPLPLAGESECARKKEKDPYATLSRLRERKGPAAERWEGEVFLFFFNPPVQRFT